MKLFAHINGDAFEFDITSERDSFKIVTPTQEILLTPDDQKGSIRSAFIDHRRVAFGWQRRENGYLILIDGIEYEVEVRDDRAERAAKVKRADGSDSGEAVVRAPIPGRIVKLLVKEGDVVAKDQPLLTLDAMKLENEIPSPRAGKVKSVQVQPGATVDRGQAMVVIA